MKEFDDLVDIISRLRKECPWDREQTHESLAKHLIEEAYELLDALAAIQTKPENHNMLNEELGDLLFTHDFDMYIAGFWFGLPIDPDFLCGFFHSTQADQGLNTSGYNNPEFDELASQQRAELDREKRKEYVWKMQDILARDVPWLPLYRILRIDTYRNDAYEGWISRPKGFPPYYSIWSLLKIKQVKEKRKPQT